MLKPFISLFDYLVKYCNLDDDQADELLYKREAGLPLSLTETRYLTSYYHHIALNNKGGDF